MFRDQSRKSLKSVRDEEKMSKLMEMYTSKEFLSKHSLLNNLFASEQLSLTFSD